MTAVLIDANVLLDLMTEDARWLAWSAEAIERAADRYRLVINPVIYAEVSIRYSRIEELDAAPPKAMFDRESIPYEAAFLAGKSFLNYRRRSGTRQSPLPELFIGAHAAVAGYLLMTRDAVPLPYLFPQAIPDCSGLSWRSGGSKSCARLVAGRPEVVRAISARPSRGPHTSRARQNNGGNHQPRSDEPGRCYADLRPYQSSVPDPKMDGRSYLLRVARPFDGGPGIAGTGSAMLAHPINTTNIRPGHAANRRPYLSSTFTAL